MIKTTTYTISATARSIPVISIPGRERARTAYENNTLKPIIKIPPLARMIAAVIGFSETNAPNGFNVKFIKRIYLRF